MKLIPKTYIITVIVIGEEANYHRKIETTKREFFYNFMGDKYRVRSEGLYRVPPSPLDRVRDRLVNRERYLIVFGQGTPEHIKRQSFHVSPQSMHKIRSAQVLRKAINELFKTDLLAGRGMIFLIIVFLAVALYILKLQGVF